MAIEVLNTPATKFQQPPPRRRDDIDDQGGHSRRKAKRSKRSPRCYNDSDELNLTGCLVMLATSGGDTYPSAAAATAINPSDQDQSKHFECNLCGKVLSSYQALGGHKTTHREKPVTAATTAASADAKSSGGVSDHHNQGGRVHECSICHKTFRSGQALGGHKRKHYEGNKSGTTTSSSGEGSSGAAVSDGGAPSHVHGGDQKISVLHTLDLNVPPVPELDLTLKL